MANILTRSRKKKSPETSKLSAMPIIGAHVSTAGGLERAFDSAKIIGAEAIQIFGSSPQQWHTKVPTQETLKDFAAKKIGAGSPPLYLHAGYLVNLASDNAELRKKSVKNLTEHLQIADALSADGLIFHPGSSNGLPKKSGLKNLIAGIKEVLENSGKAKLLLENSAGGGNKLCSTVEEISQVMRGIKNARLSACFDTAHAFEAGIIQYLDSVEVKEFFSGWDKAIGVDRLEVIHANDSKTDFRSNHDRHENIGKGKIGADGFRHLASETRLRNKIWVLEVPGMDDNGPDRENIEKLRSLF